VKNVRSDVHRANMCSMDAATILHADLDAFFASVEQRDDPALLGQPVIVGGGVVLAASYEARALGVKTAMGGRQARRLCPGAIVVRPRMQAYADASRAVYRIFEDMSGTPADIARALRRRVRAEAGLPITVGVARTKFLAKVASGVAKPDGLLVVHPDRELQFLHPLPVERLWGVGPATAIKLHAQGLTTVGEVAALTEGQLIELVGRAAGRQLHALAHNRDRRRVEAGRRRGSIGSQRAIGRGPHSALEIDATLIGIVERVTRRMRAAGRTGRTVVLRLRYADFARATRSHTMPRATAQTDAILAVARMLLAGATPSLERRGVTLVGLSVTGLERAERTQLMLPLDGHDHDALDAALDAVRDRYGSKAVIRAALLGRDRGWSPPLLPD
jgi:DNA polymerase-4